MQRIKILLDYWLVVIFKRKTFRFFSLGLKSLLNDRLHGNGIQEKVFRRKQSLQLQIAQYLYWTATYEN